MHFAALALLMQVVSQPVLSFAVDTFQNNIFYVTKDVVQNGTAGGFRLYVANSDGTRRRTLIGNGKAPEAVSMAVDPVEG